MNDQTEAIQTFENEYFVSCPIGLESYLEKELINFKFKDFKFVSGGCNLKCSFEELFNIFFYSRIASRIYKKLIKFKIRNEKDILYTARKYQWDKVFGIDQYFKIDTLIGKSPDGNRSRYNNNMYLSQVLKDAIVDQFKKEVKSRPSVDKRNPDISFLLRVEPHEGTPVRYEEATILQDLTGKPLSFRGYRYESFEAPMRENLAAALISEIEWNKKDLFIDCMCGSGTVVIEALLIYADLPPLTKRILDNSDRAIFAFENHNFFVCDDELKESFFNKLDKVLKEIDEKSAALEGKEIPIQGFDINQDSIKTTISHLSSMKLPQRIAITKQDATELNPTAEKGILFANLPYGKRLGDEEELKSLYYDLGENLKKNFKGFEAFLFTGNLGLRKKISLQTKKRAPFMNGAIECRLLQYSLY